MNEWVDGHMTIVRKMENREKEAYMVEKYTAVHIDIHKSDIYIYTNISIYCRLQLRLCFDI